MKLVRTYYSLDAAAEIAGCKAVDLLHFAVQKKCEIMFAIPDFIELRVFIQDENISEPPFIGQQPRFLVLSPENCLQIELNKACLQSDFRRGYVVSDQGGLNPMPTHYGRHHLMKTRCYWRTFKDGLVYFSEIGIDQLVIKREDLQRLLEHSEDTPRQSTEAHEQPDRQPRKRRPRQKGPTNEPQTTTNSPDGTDKSPEASPADANATKAPSVSTEHPVSTPAHSKAHSVPENSKESMKILRKKQVVGMTGLSPSTIYAKLNPKSKQYDSSFPKQFRISAGIVGWYQSDIVAWLQSRSES